MFSPSEMDNTLSNEIGKDLISLEDNNPSGMATLYIIPEAESRLSCGTYWCLKGGIIRGVNEKYLVIRIRWSVG